MITVKESKFNWSAFGSYIAVLLCGIGIGAIAATRISDAQWKRATERYASRLEQQQQERVYRPLGAAMVDGDGNVDLEQHMTDADLRLSFYENDEWCYDMESFARIESDNRENGYLLVVCDTRKKRVGFDEHQVLASLIKVKDVESPLAEVSRAHAVIKSKLAANTMTSKPVKVTIGEGSVMGMYIGGVSKIMKDTYIQQVAFPYNGHLYAAQFVHDSSAPKLPMNDMTRFVPAEW